MAFKCIKDYPESTSPSGEWFVLVDDGTGCYKKVKLSNLPGGGSLTTTTTSSSSSSSSTTSSSTSSSSSTSTSSTSSSSTSSSTSSSSTSSSSTSSTSTSSTTSTTCEITDGDAVAFIAATGITDCNIKNAINTFVIGLKADGLWTKLKAIYPFVGGTATTHKYNLKDASDNDSAFRMVFNGGVTHNSNGVTFDGATGYGDTKFAINNFNSNTDMSYGFYNRSTYNLASAGGLDFGVYGLGAQSTISGYLHRFYPSGFGLDWDTNSPKQNPAEGESYGFLGGVIRGASDAEIYRNGVSRFTQTTFINGSLPSSGQPWYLGAINTQGGSAGDYTNYNYSFAYLGDALSDAEMTNLYNRVQTMQTTLGRQV